MENQRFHAYQPEDDSPRQNIYSTEQENGVYTFKGKTSTEQAKLSPQKRAPKIKQVLALFLIVVGLFSLVGLLWQNHGLQQELESRMSALPAATVSAESAGAQPSADKHLSLYSAAVRDDTERKPLQITEIAKLGKPSVVAISTERAVSINFYFEVPMPVAGSGFFISEDGYIATNNHVVEDASNIKVHTDDGQLYEAEVVGTDPLSDLAVIKIEPHKHESFPAVKFGKSGDLEVGELAVAIGNPSGTLEGSVTAGIISALERTINIDGLELNVLQTDAAINAGNSGGALFNSFGEVIGINTAKLSGGRSGDSFEGLSFAIPSDYAVPILQDLMEHGEVVSRVQLGIAGRGFDKDFARQYRLADRPGIFVVEVVDDSPAAKAGLEAGDFIVEIDGKAVYSVSSIENMKKNWAPGDTVEVIFFREGEKQSTNMTLEAAPQMSEEETEPSETDQDF